MSNAIYPSNVKGLAWTVLRSPEFNTIVQESAAKYQVRIAQTKNPIWHFTLLYEWLYSNFLSPNNTVPYQPASDLDTLLGFFLARQGKFDDFLFFDPQDNSASGVRSGTWQPLRIFPLNSVIVDKNLHAQLVTTAGTSAAAFPNFSMTGGSTTDGTITWLDQGLFPLGWPNAPVTLPIVQDAAGTYYSPIQRNVGNLFMEDVTDLVTGTLMVYNAGVLTTNYTLLGPGLAVPGASYMGLYLKWLVPPTAPVTATFNFYYRLMFEGDTQDFEQWAYGLWTIGGDKGKNGSGTLKMMTSRPVSAF